MMSKFSSIKFKPIPLHIPDEPCCATPHAKFEQGNVVLRYLANTKEDKAAEIEFINCSTFRVGDPNDEGFYSDGLDMINESIYNSNNFPDLGFNGLFEVSGAGMDLIVKLNPGFVSNPNLNGTLRPSLKHFLFFMKDGTFECFAEKYEEAGLKDISVLEEADAHYTK